MAWLRIYDELLEDRKLSRVARDTGQSVLAVRGAWVSLLILAHQSPVEGCLCLDSKLPLDIEDVTETFHVTVDETLCLMHAFEKRGMITQDNRNIYHITNWHKRQWKSDSSTIRVRKHRGSKAVTTPLQRRYTAVAVTPPEQNTEYEGKGEKGRESNDRLSNVDRRGESQNPSASVSLSSGPDDTGSAAEPPKTCYGVVLKGKPKPPDPQPEPSPGLREPTAEEIAEANARKARFRRQFEQLKAEEAANAGAA